MDNHELELLLTDLESDRVERKRAVSGNAKNEMRQAICAFANDLPNHQKPGVLFVGVNDDGSCAALNITDELLRTLADMRSDGNITPFPMMTVQKKTLSGCELAVVLVEPADAPPVRYKGRVYIRVGPRKAIATRQEERRLSEKRRAKDLPTDIRPISLATLTDLDLDLFKRVYLPSALPIEVLEENERTTEQQLNSMRLLTFLPSKQYKPTLLGLLVIGKDARLFFPGAYIQFLRLDGDDLTAPIKDNKEIDGALPDLLEDLDEIFQEHVSVASDITTQPKEIRQPDYPIVALQQLARNAILHRTYEGTNAPVRITWFNDRIEILSPGGPFGQVNQQNFGQPGITDYRNPHLAEAMKNLGYVQRFGVGIPIARQKLQINGNPPPEFRISDTHVMVTIRRRP